MHINDINLLFTIDILTLLADQQCCDSQLHFIQQLQALMILSVQQIRY